MTWIIKNLFKKKETAIEKLITEPMTFEKKFAIFKEMDQTEEDCIKMVLSNCHFLQGVKNQTEEICLAAVKEDGEALQYVENQTDEICLAAVTKSPNSLRFVKNQTNEICLAAVKQLGYCLRYVHNQTVELCLASLTGTPYINSYEYVQIVDNPNYITTVNNLQELHKKEENKKSLKKKIYLVCNNLSE